MNAQANWTPVEAPADAVELGRLGAPWGVKGWLKLIPYSADADVLFESDEWVLKPPAGRFGRGFTTFTGAVSIEVRECKAHGDGLVVRFQGLEDRNVADSLKGCSVWVSRADFPALADDEYYWVDLIGSTVTNREGLVLGEVHEMMATGPTSVLVVKGQPQGEQAAPEHLIPFVPVYVDSVDTQAKAITVDWQPDY